MNRADSYLKHGPRGLRLGHSALGPAEAPTALLIHGITGSRRYWWPHVRELAGRYRLLVPDLPGFGRSPKPFVDYTMDFFVEALDGFLDQQLGKLGEAETTGPIHVIGHSLGAMIGLELAARIPERVARLALLNVPRFESADQAHRIMHEGSASYRRLLTSDSLSASWTQMRRTGWRLTARYMRRLPWAVLSDARNFTFRSLSSTIEHCLMLHRVDPALRRLPGTISTLIVQGERDQVAPLEAVRDLPSRYPNVELRVVRHAGHNLFHTHHDECLAHISGFLD